MQGVSTPNGIFFVHDEDIYIKSHMSSGQVYESHIINGVLKPIIEKAKYIVDVGANIGCHTISYANMNPECKIWSFEPQSSLVDILRQNCAVNNIGSDRVEIYNCALGHEEGHLSLCPLEDVYDANRAGYSRGGVKMGVGGEKTEVRTLDSLNLPGLDFMKIDVEGAEGLVILGGAETIKKYRPIIFFEHNWQTIDPKVVGREFVPTPFDALTKLGYTKFEYIDWDNYITKG
jgi:FkbM family methyltransferase